MNENATSTALTAIDFQTLFYRWTFNQVLFDTKNEETWQDILSVASYPVGVNGEALGWNTGANSNNVQFQIQDPGELFILDWSKPFAISFWLKKPDAVVASFHFQLRFNNQRNGTNSDVIWSMEVIDDEIRWQYETGSDIEGRTAPETIVQDTSILVNDWNFFYIRYDPTNQKLIYAGINDGNEQSRTYVGDFGFDTYDSAYTLAIANEGIISGDLYLDELVFWHTVAKTREEMLAIYNGGSGRAI